MPDDRIDKTSTPETTSVRCTKEGCNKSFNSRNTLQDHATEHQQPHKKSPNKPNHFKDATIQIKYDSINGDLLIPNAMQQISNIEEGKSKEPENKYWTTMTNIIANTCQSIHNKVKKWICSNQQTPKSNKTNQPTKRQKISSKREITLREWITESSSSTCLYYYSS